MYKKNNLMLLIKLINKLIIWIKLKKKIVFPKKNSIVIYSYENLPELKNILFKNINFSVLDDNKEIFLPLLFLSFFYFPFHGRYAYQYIFLRYVGAKFLISFSEDSIKISIPSYKANCKLILIQNGLRDQYCFPKLNKNKKWKAEYYFVNSENWKNWIQNKIDTKFIVTGSIKNNCFQRKKFQKIKKIVWISHFTENKVVPANFKKSRKNISWDQDVLETNKICLNIIKKFCYEKNLPLVVLPKYKKGSSQEKSFYEKFNLNLIENFKNSWQNSYELIDSNSLVISTNSTLGLELFSRNIRVVFFGIRSIFLNDPSMRFGWPQKTSDIGPFWCNLNSEKDMINVIENVFQMNEQKWNKIVSQFNHLMMYDYGNKKVIKTLSSINLLK